MTVSLSYDSSIARVLVDADGLGGATGALVERSTDSIHWDTVRGGEEVTVSGGGIVIPLSDFEFSDSVTNVYRVTAGATVQTGSIVPMLNGVWLKSIARPYLNLLVETVQPFTFPITRPARAGVFDIVGRSFPIAVSDLRRSRRWTMNVETTTADASSAMEYLLAAGDTILIHVPASMAEVVPGGYVAVGDVTWQWHPLRHLRRVWTLPVTEVAPPAATVTGVLGTWQTVLGEHSSWSGVTASYASGSDLLAVMGSGDEVIVP